MKSILFFLSLCLSCSTLLSQNKTSVNGKSTSKVVAAMSNYEMNVLYRGYNNKISVVANGFPKTAKVSCTGCIDIKQDSVPGLYLVKTGDSNTVVISIQNGKHKISQRFRVLPIPKPTVFFAGQDPLASRLPRSVVAGGILTAQLIGCPLSIPAGITGGTISVTLNGITQEYSLQGNRIPAQAAALIRQMPARSTVVIRPKAQMGGRPVRLGAVGYTLM